MNIDKKKTDTNSCVIRNEFNPNAQEGNGFIEFFIVISTIAILGSLSASTYKQYEDNKQFCLDLQNEINLKIESREAIADRTAKYTKFTREAGATLLAEKYAPITTLTIQPDGKPFTCTIDLN